MKRTIFILMMLFSASGLMSQSSILIISGHVTDSVSGNPVPGYPVYVDIDSATAGFVYHHVSFAGLNGFYVDSVFFNPSNIPSGIVWVSAWDCIHHLHTTSFAFGPSNLSVTKNFQICVPPPPPCHADFYPTLPPPPPQPLTVHFANTSVGVYGPWLWSFGDGTTSTLFSPIHTFVTVGSYHVTLQMGDSTTGGCFDTKSHDIMVGDSTGAGCPSWFTFIPDWLRMTFAGHVPFNATANYSWTFGDGTTGNGQNVDHIYSTHGIYAVTLTTVSTDTNQCTFTSTQLVHVWDSSDFHQVNGHIYEGANLIHMGVVMMFSDDSTGVTPPFFALSPVDSLGMYVFPFVPDGQFVIWALPFDSMGGYLPTYYQHALYWQQANKILLGQPGNPYDIHLLHASNMSAGQGGITGQLYMQGLKSTSAEQIAMLLTDDQGQSIGFRRVNASGSFNFSGMAYGTYYLKPELANTTSVLIKVVLSAANPVANVTMTYTGTSFLGITSISNIESFTAYPVPVVDVLNLDVKLLGSVQVNAEIFNFTGQLVFSENLNLNKGDNNVKLNLGELNSGMYSLRITSSTGIWIVQKIVK